MTAQAASAVMKMMSSAMNLKMSLSLFVSQSNNPRPTEPPSRTRIPSRTQNGGGRKTLIFGSDASPFMANLQGCHGVAAVRSTTWSARTIVTLAEP